ncbi:hypothetical protein DVH05_015196 [Phytophthora capsici]|nr:hypothetical protein DVH05_015196 [Phytophthora capsici]
MRDTTPETWDAMVKQCVKTIKSVARRERKRRKTRKHRINAQARAHLLTRKDLLRANAVDQQEEALMRQGRRLERTMEQLRWSYKMVSNWEKDQTISAIRCIHGKPFTREMSTATKFSSEWGPILGEVHNTVAPAELEARLDAFVRIPVDRNISDQQNMLLMKEITKDEVIVAIDALNRHKAAGGDGLNNDFFKDMQALLVLAMVAIGNKLLQGGDPPLSFLQDLIIPLRKKETRTTR